ncbi:MAG: 4'-phosphopantetheinyl transferase superfamily protein [Bacteroidia bacterium]
MIGNDLVAFEACREYSPQRWKAYWRKILTDIEWEDFPSKPNDHRAWLYWAAKEAAWKVWFRRSAQRLLNPKAFVVEKIHWKGSRASFEVVGADERYFGFADLTEDYLHTVVEVNTDRVLSGGSNTFSAFEVCPKDELLTSLNADPNLNFFSSPFAPSKGGQPTVCKVISPFGGGRGRKKPSNSRPKPQISLSRNKSGIPSLEIEGNVLDLPISLSHHGSWAAYAYVYPQRTHS